MKILVIGGGGREHALVWKLTRDSRNPCIYCAPGNAGTAGLATNLDIRAEDLPALVAWASSNRPDLTVVGPEAPLCAGLVDAFQEIGLRVFGPDREAARMEGSKVFAKEVMQAAGVPTARSSTFTECEPALRFVREVGAPIVVKAEGLAAGKGVSVCQTTAEAEQAVREMLEEGVFGDAGKRILIEEFLDGEEVSVLALTDGEHVVLLASAQDHKRAYDGDQGPNTGGMGAYSPAPLLKDEMLPFVEREVFQRTLAELRRRGITYKGVLYAGLMMTRNGPKVLEFNCRFGDPETQVILPRIDGDLIPALQACIDGTLSAELIRYRPESCVCVVTAAGGYPGSYRKADAISGLAEAGAVAGAVVFHAGTRLRAGGVVETSGGRVLGVTALGRDLRSAVDLAYQAVGRIAYEGMMFRRDIAQKAFRA